MTIKRIAGLSLAALLIGGWTLPAHAQTAQPCTNANCWMQIDEANDPGYQSALHGGWYGQNNSYGYSNNYNYGTPYSYANYGYSAPTYSQYPYPSTLIGTPPLPQPSYQVPSYSYNYQYAYQYQSANPQTNYYSQPTYAQPQPTYAQNNGVIRTYWKHGCLYTVRLINGYQKTTHTCSW